MKHIVGLAIAIVGIITLVYPIGVINHGLDGYEITLMMSSGLLTIVFGGYLMFQYLQGDNHNESAKVN